MEFRELSISGCFEILPVIFHDIRGLFVKTFQQSIFTQNHLELPIVEDYYSMSNINVLRGLHFQAPPMDQVKLVYCVQGKILDVFLDIRVGSPTFAQYGCIELDSKVANMVYLPRGICHGFYVLEGPAVMVYKVSTAYSEEHDQGILWSSANINWLAIDPIISIRDANLPLLKDFVSPFKYSK